MAERQSRSRALGLEEMIHLYRDISLAAGARTADRISSYADS